MNGSQIMETNTGSRKITTWQKAGKKSMVNGITCVLQEVWQRMYGRQGAEGNWYYLGPDGVMLTNTTTPDGYRVGADGVWIQ